MTSPKILIVEDNIPTAKLIQKQLKDKNYGISEIVTSGMEVIQRIKQDRPDLVLMDILLEGDMNGIQTADICNQYNVPVVYITAYEDEELFYQAKETKPFGYLLKPFKKRDLFTAVEIALGKHEDEQKLRESAEQYRELVDLSPDAITLTDLKGIIVMVNEQMKTLYGADENELVGKNLFDLIIAEDRLQAEKNIKTLLEVGEIRDIEYRLHKIDGLVYPAEYNASLVKDNEGKPTAIISVIQDITNRKLAEEALRISQEFAQNIINSSLDMIIACDDKRRITEFNKAAEQSFGYTREEVLGKHINRLYGNPERGLVVHKKTIKNGKCVEEILNRRKDGTVFPSLLNASVLLNLKGDRVGVMGISQDITELKKTQEALKQSEQKHRLLAEKLVESNALKELLLDVITHDLKNPAGVISGMADMKLSENPADEIIELIKNSTDSLLRVIDNAAILSKVVLEEEIEKEELDLVEMIEQIIKSFAPSLAVVGMSLEHHLPEMLPVKANPIIAEVFNNYISNAIKYAKAGKKIVIEGKRKADFITIAVKDFGTSIPEIEYEHIFERNIQLRTQEKRGRGLGLAIVKRIAEAHNAEFGIIPNKPNGNIFFIKIPL